MALVWLDLGRPEAKASAPLLPADQLDLVRIALIVTGGLGGLVALVVAYRRQRLLESENERSERSHSQENYKLFNDLYITTSALLGDDSAAVRQAGVYGFARLADDWPRYRQACVDVLAAYVRTPTQLSPAGRAGEREVRSSIVAVLAEHLRESASDTWRGCTVDVGKARIDGRLVGELIGVLPDLPPSTGGQPGDVAS